MPVRAVALEDVGVQRIEGRKDWLKPRADELRKHAALRRVRIDVVEIRKVGRIFQIAEDGEAVAFGSPPCRASAGRGATARSAPTPRRAHAGE